MSLGGLPNVGGGDLSSSIIPLSGLVGASVGGAYPDENAVVDYHGVVYSSMVMRGVADAAPKGVSFRVGVRAARANIARPNVVDRVDTSMPVVEELRKSIQEMSRRVTALPAVWERMELFGVVRRLAMGCAYYSVWGGITAVELRGGGNANIVAVAATVNPVAADNGAVFCSAKLVGHARPNVLAALMNAISGEGGTMYTDLLSVNMAGVVQVPNAQDAALAQGCHEALRILGAMFKACDKGAFFGLAIAQGVHRIKSVHGHTDEGAYVRDIFRRKESGVPYGAVIFDLDPDNALPSPQRSVAGFRAVYDAIALATAGAVALADPMVNYHGRDYPTVLVTDRGDEADPGSNNDGDALDAQDLSTQWAENCGAWSKYYALALNDIFVTKGGVEEVQRLLTCQANSLAGVGTRHLHLKVAVAFFWIEPTCSCPVGDLGYPAYVANHGPMATSARPRTIPALDGCAVLSDRSDNVRTTVQVDYRYVRRHGLFMHLAGHERNGIANVTLESGVVNDFLLVGGAGDVGPRVLARNAFSTFLWGRGLSMLPSGGEMMSLSKSNVFTFEHVTRRNNTLRNTNTPHRNEMSYGDVLFTASRLVAQGVGPPGGVVPPRDVRRARSRAAIALSLAADAGRSEYIINDQLMRPSLIDYGPLPTTGEVRRSSDETHVVHVDVGAVDVVNPVLRDGDVAGRTGHLPGGQNVNGPAAPIRIENRADRGPRPPRPGRIGGGGVQGVRVAGAGGGEGGQNAPQPEPGEIGRGGLLPALGGGGGPIPPVPGPGGAGDENNGG